MMSSYIHLKISFRLSNIYTSSVWEEREINIGALWIGFHKAHISLSSILFQPKVHSTVHSCQREIRPTYVPDQTNKHLARFLEFILILTLVLADLESYLNSSSYRFRMSVVGEVLYRFKLSPIPCILCSSLAWVRGCPMLRVRWCHSRSSIRPLTSPRPPFFPYI